jgi:hypothetical protein
MTEDDFAGTGHIPTELEVALAAAKIGGKLLGDEVAKNAELKAEIERMRTLLLEVHDDPYAAITVGLNERIRAALGLDRVASRKEQQ